MHKKSLILIITLFLFAACSTPAGTTPTAETSPETASTPVRLLSDPKAYWKEFRESRFGFGIAVPCWWQITPTPADGEVSTMNIHNYDDAYFQKFSENGVWKGGTPPQEVISIDITAINVDPNLSIENAYMQRIDSSKTELVSAQEKKVGTNTYTVVTIRNKANPNYPVLTVFAIKTNPDTLITFVVYPPQQVAASDVQEILASFAGNKAQAVTIPNVAPSPALSNMSCPI